VDHVGGDRGRHHRLVRAFFLFCTDVDASPHSHDYTHIGLARRAAGVLRR
jgi:hypothetical protein